ncbi:MAG: DUF2220 family protein [Methylotenera sp.]|nr:DUF2220 family protein [Methylotenera sp.]
MGLPATTIMSLASKPSMVLTIENQTTFHSEARRKCDEDVLLIYTAGMPNPPWRDMYARLLKSLPEGIPVYHWGDLDEGGFRIASVLASVAKEAGHILQPWQISDNVDIAIKHGHRNGLFHHTGGFLYADKTRSTKVRNRSALESTERKIELIVPEELDAAILDVVRMGFSISQEAAVSGALDMLGLGRASANLANTMNARIDGLLKAKRVKLHEEKLLPV